MGEGILNNELYIGRRIFNRRKWIEVTTANRSFKRQPLLNPESEWSVTDCPKVRIVDQALWDRVKLRQAEARAARDAKFKLTGNPLAGAKCPQHLLSGLVRCGVCGEPYVSTGKRWRCKAAVRKACSNSSILGDQLEARAPLACTTACSPPMSSAVSRSISDANSTPSSAPPTTAATRSKRR